MSRSIFGSFHDEIYGYNNAFREMEKAINAGREMEKAINAGREMERALGLGREVERVLDQERQYRRAFELGSPYTKAVQELSASSRDLFEAALGPLPSLGGLSSASIARQAGISGALRRINNAIAEAPFLGKAEAQEEPVSEEQSEVKAEEPNQELEPQLVKVVSAEVLTQIRLPLSELSRVLHHPEAMRMLTARDFERFIATLVEQLGFEDVVLTPSSGDHGRDVLATKKVSGIPIFFAFECKRYAPDRLVGPETARALLGTIMHGATRASMGVLVTTSTFTPAARQFILTEPVLDGKDFDGIMDWLKEYSARTRRKAVG
jgi:HJR/Mrr/RecB family endonuclease